jgi:hypothetical protein
MIPNLYENEKFKVTIEMVVKKEHKLFFRAFVG